MNWQDIFHAVGHPVFILSPTRTILDANAATLRATGFLPTEVIGRKCFDIFHPDLGGEVPEGCPLGRCLDAKRLATEEMEVSLLGGTYLVSCTPVVDGSGQVDRVIHIATDVTESREKARIIADREESYRVMLDHVRDMVMTGTPSGVIRFANVSASRALGYSPEELESMHCLRLIHASDHHVFAALEELIPEYREVSGRVRVLRRDGSSFPAEFTIVCRAFDDTDLAMVVARDVSGTALPHALESGILSCSGRRD